MRKLLFRVMIIIVFFLLMVLGVAARKHISPKAVLQSWFTRHATGTVMTGMTSTDMTGGNMIPIETSSSSTGLSDQDKSDTQNFLNSMGQQQ